MDEQIIEQKPKKKVKASTIVVIILLAFFAFCIISAISIVFPVYKTGFSAEETAEIGQEYNMDLSGVEIKVYKHVMAQDCISQCKFDVDDYSTFMEQNFKGEILEADDWGTDEVRYYCKPYEDVEGQKKTRISICFRKKKDKWQADLIHSRYVG